ncbi:hypothetical protein WJX72_011028 [[Myrmecia] bisecta]|uniref:Uncharacterized protein n=1 Tax=[Myrmecia] bisecta TaxID=41462 RepID=A0AAW1Q4V3_9CHLO
MKFFKITGRPYLLTCESRRDLRFHTNDLDFWYPIYKPVEVARENMRALRAVVQYLSAWSGVDNDGGQPAYKPCPAEPQSHNWRDGNPMQRVLDDFNYTYLKHQSTQCSICSGEYTGTC